MNLHYHYIYSSTCRKGKERTWKPSTYMMWTELLLTIHWPTLGHMVPSSYRRGWRIQFLVNKLSIDMARFFLSVSARAKRGATQQLSFLKFDVNMRKNIGVISIQNKEINCKNVLVCIMRVWATLHLAQLRDLYFFPEEITYSEGYNQW